MRKKSSKVLSILLSFMMTITALMPVWSSAATSSGKDYDHHWAKSAIIKALDMGILKGYSDGSIKPDQKMTRMEFFSMVNAAFGYTVEADVSFVDMYPSAWYTPVIKRAFVAGYLSTIKSLGTASVGSKLSDLNKATPEGYEAILSILEAKIMQGTPDKLFMPKADIKRQ